MRALQVVVAVTIVGCVSSHPGPPVQTVAITTNRDGVKGCRSLGVVDASDNPSDRRSTDNTPPEGFATAQLRVAAARLGANVLLMNESPTGMRALMREQGEAYVCERHKQ
jgi:hypothetical protein